MRSFEEDFFKRQGEVVICSLLAKWEQNSEIARPYEILTIEARWSRFIQETDAAIPQIAFA